VVGISLLVRWLRAAKRLDSFKCLHQYSEEHGSFKCKYYLVCYCITLIFILLHNNFFNFCVCVTNW
jgi:hypothetical protein